MAIVLLLICFLGLSLICLSLDNTRLSILKSILIFSVLTLGITEFLSFFTSLNYFGLIAAWSVVDVLVIYFIYKKASYQTLPLIKGKLKKTINKLTGFEKFLIGFSGFIAVGILLQGLFYPTNNWDSMLYHMARVIHWIQNESLAHYRTPFHQQLIFPVFSEVMILNVNLLLGNDFLSNTVQLLYMITTGVAIGVLAKELGLNKFGQILSSFILICIPEVILLASSTHNELVLSFFMIMSIYFLLKTKKDKTLNNFIFLGCCLGLSAATKSTAYVYLAPFILMWTLYHLYQVLVKSIPLIWLNYLIVGLVFVTINFAHYSRNYQLTSTIFGTNEELQRSYANEYHSFPGLISSVSKNLSSQFGIPKIAPLAKEITEEIHELINVNIDDYQISYTNYSIDPLSTHENNGANPYHTVLMMLSTIWLLIFFKRYNRSIVFFCIVSVLSFLLFCLYLKWQIWIKLHTPFFIFYTIVLAHFLIQTVKSKIIFRTIIFGFSFYAVVILLFNYSRPFITVAPFTSEIKIADDRYKKYFSRFLKYHFDFKTVNDLIASYEFKNIGLMYEDYGMEYQLFLDSYCTDLKPIHINSFDLCDKIPVIDQIDCIVSTKSVDSIYYEEEMFYNATPSNDGYLYLFLKK